jgi:hypothetical protein
MDDLDRLAENQSRDETEMRELYRACGISERTIEAAIAMRRKRPLPEERLAIARKRAKARQKGR